ncbi:DUF5686 and carboxypeptidase-like regulatory domain-containing protein [Bacteroides neonati]|nr:DUF5686 and carboxypeptidase-like regulatory domain-containing protein [Bacteroides neonati]
MMIYGKNTLRFFEKTSFEAHIFIEFPKTVRTQWLKSAIVLSLLVFTIPAKGQDILIKGVVTDSITGEPLPSVSLILKGTTIGAPTDYDGRFSFSAPSKAGTLKVSYIGYTEKEIQLIPGKTGNLSILLVPTSISLSEVVVKPTRERYTKKDNPAVAFVKNVIRQREQNDPRNKEFYSYDQYEKIMFAMNDYKPKSKKDGKVGQFDFLNDYIDTLEIGKTILPVSEREKLMSVYYRKDPKSEKCVMKAAKADGVDELLSPDGMQEFLNEVFKEVNIFQNDIPLFLNRFVSPLSAMGPNFYKYYMLDTLEVAGQKCVDLGFAPFTPESFGFTGHLFITLDSTYFVQRVKLNVPKKINLNFVGGMTIEQTFCRTPDGTRLLTKDDIKVDFKVTEKSKGIYAQRLNIYTNHAFDAPVNMSVFSEGAPIIIPPEAYKRSSEYWEDHRPDEAGKRKSKSVGELMERLRTVPVFYAAEQVITAFVNGYVPSNSDPAKSKFELGPVNTIISGNSIEGARFRVGGTTTTAFNKRLFVNGYVAYGTRDHKLKYDAAVEYSFIDKKNYPTEFPVHSLRLEYMYDVNQLGQHYLYTNKDNIFVAIKRQRDTRATFQRKAELTYYREHYNGVSYGAALRNLTEYSTRYAVFDRIDRDQKVTSLKDYHMTELELKLRYAPNEKFYQTRDSRFPITFDAPVFTLSHTMSFKDVLGSSYNYQKTEFGIRKRFWLSAYGAVDIIGKVGKVWSTVPYPLLILPNANLSYLIQSESYTNMNAMEFINDEYASWDLTYNMNGLILNSIPLIKKLKWREVVTFRGLFGNLTNKNNPYLTERNEGLFQFPEGSYIMDKKVPYMEMGVGIENIFKFIRVDYTWRLSYKNHPGIQDRGIRIQMKMTF